MIKKLVIFTVPLVMGSVYADEHSHSANMLAKLFTAIAENNLEKAKDATTVATIYERQQEKGLSAFNCAIWFGSHDIVRYFLAFIEENAEYLSPNCNDDYASLNLAVLYADCEMLRLLLQADRVPRSACSCGSNIVHAVEVACIKLKEDAIRLLLDGKKVVGDSERLLQIYREQGGANSEILKLLSNAA